MIASGKEVALGPFYPALGFPSDRELGFPSDRELARYNKEVEYPAHVLNKEVAEKRVLSGIEMAFDKFRL